jgi:alcohol dehydrogenase
VGWTAYQALKRGGVKAGSKVFIPGGAGGVGSIAIQIAKKVLKAEYVCTTASPGIGADICIECGADRVINYREDDFAVILKDENIDMVFDTMNEGYKMGDILKPNEGKVISISGSPTIEAIEEVSGEQSPALMVKVFSFFTRNRKAEQAASKVGCDWEYMFMVPSGDQLNELAPYLESGEIKVIIDKIAPSLDDFMVAVDRLWSGNSKGKNVIKVI